VTFARSDICANDISVKGIAGRGKGNKLVRGKGTKLGEGERH
jgi:hypothetical protein